jgi:hypothetical protein
MISQNLVNLIHIENSLVESFADTGKIIQGGVIQN